MVDIGHGINERTAEQYLRVRQDQGVSLTRDAATAAESFGWPQLATAADPPTGLAANEKIAREVRCATMPSEQSRGSSEAMSDKPVAERLQVKGNRRLAVIGASATLEKTVGAGKARAEISNADVVLLFAPDRARLDAELPGLLEKLAQTAILWVAYPKLSSRLAADLSRDIIHALAPLHGLDTVSQVAIDADWSALRLKRVPPAK